MVVSSEDQRKPVSVEQQREIQRFTDEEKKVLLDDGAEILELAGETIRTQTESQKAKGKPSFWRVIDGGERLVDRPSRFSEVAIYPDPERFFVDGTGGKSVAQQEKLVEQDTEELCIRLGLEGVTVVIPEEASTLTEVVFKHLDKTGDWLFSEKHAQIHGLNWIYGRTKNPINTSGSRVAVVGDARPARGLYVDYWGFGYGSVWAVRLVVPKGTR